MILHIRFVYSNSTKKIGKQVKWKNFIVNKTKKNKKNCFFDDE